MQEKEIIGIFPTPVYITKYPFSYEKELEYIRNIECKHYNEESNMQQGVKQSIDTFVLDNLELKKIKNFIEEKILEFSSKVMGYANELVITQSWINKAIEGERHQEHVHPNSIVSGVWYPFISEDLPPIIFHNKIQRELLP
jgi:hypothetical protein